MKRGMVYLVGAGPGDLGLITIRARELIRSCDVLVYDYLVNATLITWCRPDCERIYVGKSPGRHSIEQVAIERILIDRARRGKRVVRLKGGDPFIFGRGGEEICRLDALGIDFEVVPGITAALAAAAYGAVALTHRDHGSSLCFLTGHEQVEKQALRVDFRQFARIGDTLCIYMGMATLERIVADLIAGGKPAHTPVAVVQWASLSQQRSLFATLETVVEAVEAEGFGPPAIVIIGKVVQAARARSWLEKKPLWGRRIVVTRSQDQAEALLRALSQAGAQVLELPLIQIRPIVDSEAAENVFEAIANYEWLVFTSINGARYFFDLFFKRFDDIRCLGPMRMAAVGSATAREIERYRLRVDLVSEKGTAASLAEALMGHQDVSYIPILVVVGNLHREDLIQTLETQGQAIVDKLIVYHTEKTDLIQHPAVQEFREQGADAIVFTSSSTVESFVDQASSLKLEATARPPLNCSIGPVTTATLKRHHLPVAIEAEVPNQEGIVKALVQRFGG